MKVKEFKKVFHLINKPNPQTILIIDKRYFEAQKLLEIKKSFHKDKRFNSPERYIHFKFILWPITWRQSKAKIGSIKEDIATPMPLNINSMFFIIEQADKN